MTIPWDRPQTPRALHAWIAATLDIRIARKPLVGGHNAPFDYLVHTHFEGSVPPNDPPDTTEPAAPTTHDLHTDGSPGAPDSRSALTPPLRGPDAPSLRHTPTHPPDVVLWANRGGGKTFLGAVATTLDLLFKPGIQVRILAGSLEQASRMFAHLRRFFSIPDLARQIDGRITQRRLTLRNESTAEILAASEASVRGTRVQKLRCDEVDLFDHDLWEAAQLTTRSESLGGIHVRGAVECLSTMHVPHGLMFNLVKDTTTGARRLLKWGILDTLELCPSERPCDPCPLLKECGRRAKPRSGRAHTPPTGSAQQCQPAPDHPNPDADPDAREAGHITITDAITLKSRVSQSAWESEMLCLRPTRSHAVFPEFDPKLHVVESTPREGVAWLAAMDFGFRADTVILWAALDHSNTLWIVDEHCQAEMLLTQHIDAIASAPDKRSIPLPQWIAVDPAGLNRSEQTGLSNVDALRKRGLPVRARRAPLGVGLAALRTRLRPALGPTRLLIHKRCTRLIESLERYHYPVNDPESMIPVKDGHDHAVDALRYLVLNLDAPGAITTSSYTDPWNATTRLTPPAPRPRRVPPAP